MPLRDALLQVVLAASNPSSTQQSIVTIGTVSLGVVTSGVTLIEGLIQSLLVRTTDYSAVHQEVQGVPFVAGRGYASVTRASLWRRARTLASATFKASPEAATVGHLERERTMHVSQRQLQDVCDPCKSRVWGDFNGDCQFLTSDVDYLAQVVLTPTLQPFRTPSELICNCPIAKSGSTHAPPPPT